MILRFVKIALIIIAGAILLIVGLKLISSKRNLNLQFPTSSPGVNFQTKVVVQEESAVISVFEKSSPSVVAIGVTERVVDPFDPQAIPKNLQNTIGTGFVVSKEGIIVTNRHVVSDPGAKYSVVLKNGGKYDVKKIFKDPNLDMAIVQIEASNLTPLPLGDSKKLKPGQSVVAIGNALGKFDNTITTGVVSGLGREVVAGNPFIGAEQLDNLIQTDAAINPGNSGGPLLNLSGEVIGVNVALTEGAENIGFAIPINEVKAVVDEFLKTGKISRPFLGVGYRIISRDLALLNEVPQGAYIQEVVENTPAKDAGILVGDIITKMDGKNINGENSVADVLKSKKVGDRINIDIWRDGKTINLTATLKESPNI